MTITILISLLVIFIIGFFYLLIRIIEISSLEGFPEDEVWSGNLPMTNTKTPMPKVKPPREKQ